MPRTQPSGKALNTPTEARCMGGSKPLPWQARPRQCGEPIAGGERAQQKERAVQQMLPTRCAAPGTSMLTPDQGLCEARRFPPAVGAVP
jgi:hypothetical protein